jgi:hypothetical protein
MCCASGRPAASCAQRVASSWAVGEGATKALDNFLLRGCAEALGAFASVDVTEEYHLMCRVDFVQAESRLK